MVLAHILAVYGAFIARHPGKMLAGCWAVVIGLSLVAYFMDWINISEQSAYDWAVNSAIQTEQDDALDDAFTNLEFIGAGSDDEAFNRTLQSNELYLTYEVPQGEDVFSPMNLQSICEMERVVIGFKAYPDFCVKDSAAIDAECKLQAGSVVSTFYGDNSTACHLLDQEVVDLKVNFFKNVVENPSAFPPAQLAGVYFFLSNSFGEEGEKETWVNVRTRSVLRFGWPLEPDRVKGLDSLGVRTYLDDNFFRPLEQAMFDFLGMTGGMYQSEYEKPAIVGDVSIKFFSGNFFNRYEFARVVNTDFTAVIFSLIFVFGYLTFHLGSIFLSSISIMQMLCSIPVSLFFYNAFLQINYFSQMHILVIFLILGVGADDVFVFVGFWKQTDTSMAVEARLTATIHHTLTAVFNTSFTTAVAFIATAISPIMPISAFGYFAALCVLFNYIFCVTITPAAVLVWANAFEHKSYLVLLGCRKAEPLDIDEKQAKILDTANREADSNSSASDSSTNDQVVPAHDLEMEEDPALADDGHEAFSASLPLDEAGAKGAPYFFHHYYAPFLNYKIGIVKPFAILIILLGIGMATLGMFYAQNLETPKTQEQWFRSGHMFTGLQDYLADSFRAGESSRYLNLRFVFGIEGVDRSGFNQWIPDKDRGVAVYDSEFHLSTREAQDDFIEACGLIRNASCDIESCEQGPLKNSLVFSEASVTCFMEPFLAWYQQSLVVANITSEPDPRPEGETFTSSLREFLASSYGTHFSGLVGFNDGNLTIAIIQATGSVYRNQPNGVLVPYHDFVVDFVETSIIPINSKLFRSAFVHGGQNFGWMVTQIKLVQGMFNGLALCFPVAWLVLLIATNNIFLSLYATFGIAAIVSCVLGVAHLQGWALGMAESIATIIVVGFSVDFSIHLMHIYAVGTERGNRGARVDEAVTRMGHVILAGAATTFGSGAVMFICQMTFFFKMAVLICLTISFSVAFSLGWLMALCAVLGPVNHQGEMSYMLCYFCSRNKKND